MSRFTQALKSDRFLVTAELNPPKGTDVEEVLSKAEALKGMVDALNLTDQQSSVMTTSPLALAHLLLDRDIEPILQVTCRDRNRIALQSDLLAAWALGIENVLCLTGDPVSTGDHPDAKTVFDLEAIGLLKGATALISGKDLGGNQIKGAPSFTLGGVVNPGASDLGKEIRRMEEKIEAGATFFQSQAIFDARSFEHFVDATKHLNVPVLAGLILLKSGNMARNMNQNLPGVHVPDALIQEMDQAEDRPQKSVEIAGRLINEIRGLCRGVHIMAIGWERRIPQVLEAAGLLPARPGG